MSRVSQVSARPSHVRERLIGALIPNAIGPGDESARIPLPALPALSRLDNLQPTTLRVSTSRMDRSGRVHERILLRELGWNPGSRVDMDTMHAAGWLGLPTHPRTTTSHRCRWTGTLAQTDIPELGCLTPLTHHVVTIVSG